MKPRYLSKSRFKLGHECPTKLYYTGKKEYENANDEDEFLKSLAEGGFQVGELAKLYYPGGIEPTERDYQKAHDLTSNLIIDGTKTIYEASVLYKNLFIRIDILNRTSTNTIDLIEVKAKSFDSAAEEPFWNKTLLKKKTYQLHGDYEAYLYDVAFQTYVARLAFPHIVFTPYLLLADKNKLASVDGLNQHFPIIKDKDGRSGVGAPPDPTKVNLGDKILIKVPVHDQVEWIINQSKNGKDGISFADYVETLADLYENDQKYPARPTKDCNNCEFYAPKIEQSPSNISGFHECWKEAFKTTDEILEKDLVTDLWNFRQKDAALNSGIFLMKDLSDGVITLKENDDGTLSQSARQALQLGKVKANDNSIYVNLDGLRSEMSSWTYPLHFIDFETATVAIPFHKGQRPYGPIAFQFSHHRMEKDGTFHHKSEYLHSEPGKFPNYDFVRALKNALSTDQGSIFRYHNHENTFLNAIAKQLNVSQETDRVELIAFISNITQNKDDNRFGPRNMVDLCDLVIKYYFDPMTKGSNSIKSVLPAILKRSKFIQKKYSKPIYGTSEILSHNFKNHMWIKKDEGGTIINPYYTLPPVFQNVSFEQSERLFSNEELREGGSASVAFARLQFEKMSDLERKAIREALLRYCELDTLAMVMLVEHFLELV